MALVSLASLVSFDAFGAFDTFDPGLVDDASLREGDRLRAMAAPTVIYSNFSDGTTTLSRTSENAPKNQSLVCGGVYPKWSGTPARARDLQNQLGAMMADFNVVLAAKRPAAGPYTMIMVGSHGTGCPGVPTWSGGIAALDCENKNPNNVAYDFSDSGDVVTMAQEVGHTFGLDHNDVACDVMGAGYSSKACGTGKWGYMNTTGPLTSGKNCGPTTQNSYAEMKRILGAWPGGPHPDPMGDGADACTDAAAPTVTIVEPADGATVGPSFTVRATASDDCPPIVSARIEIPKASLSATAAAPPYQWSLSDLATSPALEIIVTVTDGAGKIATTKVTVKVGSGAVGDAGGGGGGGGAGGAGAATDGGQGGNGGGSADPAGGAGNGGAPGGCAIASGRDAVPARSAAVISLGTIALGWIAARRRRPHRR